MRAWFAAAAAAFLLISWCRAPCAQEDKNIYLWKDRTGKTHLTEEPPQEGGAIQERFAPAPGPAPASRRRPKGETAEADRGQDAYERCRLADQARQFALTARQEANALKRKAEDARHDVEDLKERVGFDDERLENFKYDIRRLEENARWLEALAKQAGMQADSADLQSRLAQFIAGSSCP